MDLKNKSDAELQYIMEDCRKAVQAMPQNPKSIAYLMEANACEDELRGRERIRIMRRELKSNNHDPLVDYRKFSDEFHPSRRRKVWGIRINAYSTGCLRSAMYILGWYRLYNLI